MDGRTLYPTNELANKPTNKASATRELPSFTPMNQLVKSSSAYLQQHAHNPVNWWPWGAEALESAAAQGQWLLVSIGYSTCHWCHVMKHEIFEDVDCAAYMNQHFKNIKVDREERPDLDHTYMQAALALNGQGGWPLNVVCLPDGRPVWASTYLPKSRWLGALERLVEVQQNQQVIAVPYAKRLADVLEAAARIPSTQKEEQPVLTPEIVAAERGRWDYNHGGLNGAPKFPLPSYWMHLMALGVDAPLKNAIWQQAAKTVEAIFHSGSYDGVRGGLFRYSTDASWKVPHFEKMAYDNGLWLRLCAHLHAHSPSEVTAQAFERTAEWLYHEMHLENGLFAAAMDADTDGVEGGSFTWADSALVDALGAESAAHFRALLEAQGAFWKGRWILHWHPAQGLPTSEWTTYLAALKPFALERPLPFRDPKCIQAWNAWICCGLAEGAHLFPAWKDLALASSEAHWATFQPGATGSPHVKYPGKSAEGQAFLDDLAASANTCIAMAQLTGEVVWLHRAAYLVEAADAHWTGEAYAFAADRQDDPAFLVYYDWEDDVLPSAQSTMASCLLRLGHLLGRPEWSERARSLVLRAVTHESLSAERSWSWWALAPWIEDSAEHLLVREGLRLDNRPKHPLWGPSELPADVYGQVCTLQACTLVLKSRNELDAYLRS